jgi:hypothetical protein
MPLRPAINWCGCHLRTKPNKDLLCRRVFPTPRKQPDHHREIGEARFFFGLLPQ